MHKWIIVYHYENQSPRIETVLAPSYSKAEDIAINHLQQVVYNDEPDLYESPDEISVYVDDIERLDIIDFWDPITSESVL